MRKIILCFFLASITAQAGIVSDTIRLVGSIDESGCNASVPVYKGLDKPQSVVGLRKVGEIVATIECYGSRKMNMFLVAGERNANVYFRDTQSKIEISALSPMKFSGEFETQVTVDVLLNRHIKEYDSTVRLVLDSE